MLKVIKKQILVTTFIPDVRRTYVNNVRNAFILISERIEASDLMCCEWCTEQKLPALFLQTSPQTCLHLQVQLDMFEDDSRMWCDCQSRSESQIQTLQQSTRDEV